MSSTVRATRAFTVFAILNVLAACGGGGGVATGNSPGPITVVGGVQ